MHFGNFEIFQCSYKIRHEKLKHHVQRDLVEAIEIDGKRN